MAIPPETGSPKRGIAHRPCSCTNPEPVKTGPGPCLEVIRPAVFHGSRASNVYSLQQAAAPFMAHSVRKLSVRMILPGYYAGPRKMTCPWADGKEDHGLASTSATSPKPARRLVIRRRLGGEWSLARHVGALSIVFIFGGPFGAVSIPPRLTARSFHSVAGGPKKIVGPCSFPFVSR